MSLSLLSVSVRLEQDVVAARQRARQIAALLGCDVPHQTRLATAVSEIARNAYNYAAGGRVEFAVEGRTKPQLLLVRISDHGPGIRNLDEILSGQYRSRTGMGLGIIGARRLMDHFEIESVPGKTTVTLKMLLARQAPLVTAHSLPRVLDELSRQIPESAFDELQRQNRELMNALEELRSRQEELVRLNHELEDTNRGVVALYAELDEKADHLRRADEVKSRFISNMSHELRTPLNSILALSRLLLDRADGDLTPDQERQIYFVRKSAESLYELVNDLLDLAKVEAGKIAVRPAEFDVKNLFGALRGMLRPLLLNTSVSLVFEEPDEIPPLLTDEGKVSQILRNFISNALKFTERGEVRVSARVEGSDAIFSVADTGLGIAEEDQERIFQEFTQLESPIQHKVRGTGLGLPLSRKLAELLGGKIIVRSQLGVGSVFSAVIPVTYAGTGQAEETETTPGLDDSRVPVLVVEDHYETRLIYEKFLKGSAFQLIPARSLPEARRIMRTLRPQAIILDILLQNEDTWDFLAELKANPETKEIPLLVATSVEDQQKGLSLGADVYAVKPIERQWLLEHLIRLTTGKTTPRVLLIDDDEVSRYLLKQLFAGMTVTFLEAADGTTGMTLARNNGPDLIFLDLIMPGISGLQVLATLQEDPATRSIPVIVATSKLLAASERDQLAERTAGVLSKSTLSSGSAERQVREILTDAGLAHLFRAAGETFTERPARPV